MAKDFEREYGPREEEPPFFECRRCGKECEGEPTSIGTRNASDGLLEEFCADCDRRQRQWEEVMGLLTGSGLE